MVYAKNSRLMIKVLARSAGHSYEHQFRFHSHADRRLNYGSITLVSGVVDARVRFSYPVIAIEDRLYSYFDRKCGGRNLAYTLALDKVKELRAVGIRSNAHVEAFMEPKAQ